MRGMEKNRDQKRETEQTKIGDRKEGKNENQYKIKGQG